MSDNLTKKFRKDIQGLRAISVLLVIFYHFSIPGFSGGYVGVDIFFVISGFLITGIIVRRMDEGRFSFGEFYKGRAFRILPALMVTIGASLLAALWLLLPTDLIAFAESAVYAQLFAANLYFFQTIDYFTAGADTMPLIHTWSLAVEEQFYLVVPIGLFLFFKWKQGRAILPAVLLILAIASFASFIRANSIDQQSAFYLPHNRAWEFLVGSLVYFALRGGRVLTPSGFTQFLAALGGAMILVSLVLFPILSTDSFNVWQVALSVIGSALILYVGAFSSPLISRILSQQPLTFIGNISYSAYLVHWPIFVFYAYHNIVELSRMEVGMLVLASLLIAALSYWLIEQPARHRFQFKSHSGMKISAIYLGVTAVFTAILISLSQTGGWPERFPVAAIDYVEYEQHRNPRRNECHVGPGPWIPFDEACIYGADTEPKFMVWGDSHADALVNEIGLLAEKNGEALRFESYSGCPTVINVRRQNYEANLCPQFNEAMLQGLARHPEIHTVILIARHSVYVEGTTRDYGPAERYSDQNVLVTNLDESISELAPRKEYYAQQFEQTIERIAAMNRRIVLVYPVPEIAYDVPRTLARFVAQGRSPSDLTIAKSDYETRNEFIIGVMDSFENESIVRVKPADKLCESDRCITVNDGDSLYFDDDHLSLEGGAYISELFAPLFELPR